MGSRADLIKGLEILEKYDPEGYCDAQHDIIYGGYAEGVSEEDAAELERLGWHIDGQADDSWAFFT